MQMPKDQSQPGIGTQTAQRDPERAPLTYPIGEDTKDAEFDPKYP